jgi:hypothetical protein
MSCEQQSAPLMVEQHMMTAALAKFGLKITSGRSRIAALMHLGLTIKIGRTPGTNQRTRI